MQFMKMFGGGAERKEEEIPEIVSSKSSACRNAENCCDVKSKKDSINDGVESESKGHSSTTSSRLKAE